MAKTLRIFAYIWLLLFALVLLVSAFAHIRAAPSLWVGVGDVLYWFNPYNFISFIVNLISISPALIALRLAERFDKPRVDPVRPA